MIIIMKESNIIKRKKEEVFFELERHSHFFKERNWRNWKSFIRTSFRAAMAALLKDLQLLYFLGT